MIKLHKISQKHFLLVSVQIACLLFVGLIFTTKAHAVTAADWKAGRIIDDVVFFNKGSMTVGQIQEFLNNKVPNCDTNGTGLTGRWNSAANRYYTRAEWGASVGNPAPFTCLKDYVENPTTKVNNYHGGAVAGGISAAQIIYNSAQTYTINPQVLLVLLQKEQSLISDDWPYLNQFQYATGAYCPDSGAGGSANCDPNQQGFATQVMSAGNLYKYYKEHINYYNYNVGNNYILWNVAPTGCGGGNVNIENIATAMLYIYTPYQPNAASLGNMYGQGDGCSAYGNRNFWRMFNDWFGSTYAPTYMAQYFSQTSYPTIIAGESSSQYLMYKNIGSSSWLKNGSNLHLATSEPINRSSSFGLNWNPTANRPNLIYDQVFESDGTTPSLDQNVVKPGQVVKLSFVLSTDKNLAPGNYREFFQPILEGSPNWNLGGTAWIDIKVEAPVYSLQYIDQTPHQSLVVEESKDIYVRFKNTGNKVWYDARLSGAPAGTLPVALATDNQINRTSDLGVLWPTSNRPSVLFNNVYEPNASTLTADQRVVLPGQIASFKIPLRAHNNPSLKPFYREYFRPILEGSSDGTLNNPGMYTEISLSKRQTSFQYSSQSPYPVIQRGTTASVYIAYKNSSNHTVYNSSSGQPVGSFINFASSNPITRSSIFNTSWFGTNKDRPAISFNQVLESDGVTLSINQDRVEPGQIVKFVFILSAPSAATPGTYREFFQPVLEGSPNWQIGGLAFLDVTITL